MHSITIAALLLTTSVRGAGAFAQQPAKFQILLLDGNDGKPMGKIGLFLMPSCDKSCVFPDKSMGGQTNDRGEMDVATFDRMRRIEVLKSTSNVKYCQGVADKNDNLDKNPSFSLDAIFRAGVVAPNRCNDHRKIKPRPGQLVFFLRPLTMWEKLTKPPQM
jgi:hypothetical protein